VTRIGDAMHILKVLIGDQNTRYGLSLLKIHEKYKKYIFHIIFYASLINNDKQTKKGKEINIFKA
jgi:hypothetical protein